MKLKDTCHRALRLTLLFSLLLWLVLALFRLAFAMLYVPFSVVAGNASSLPLLLYNALRFDLQVTAYAALLPTALALASAFLPIGRAVKGIVKWYYVVVATLVAVLECIDLGYYANFGTHISVTFFDFFDEGPAELAVAIWEEYPVMKFFFAVVAVAALLAWVGGRLGGKVFDARISLGWKGMAGTWVAYVALLVACLRGSLGMFPLQVEDIIVCTDERINNLVPNAPYMLKKAMKEKSQAFKFRPVGKLLADYGFNNLQEALDAYTDGRVRLSADTTATLQSALFAQAPDTLAKPQPNVVILCCESWSNYLMELQSKDDDVLCGLQRHLDEDMLLRRFQSVRNGTVATMECVSVATPFLRMFRSKYRYQPLPTSITVPFKASGYTCEFVTGMDQAWENCGEALRCQGFDKVTGKYELMRENPKAVANSIGVYDEYMLQALLARLCQRSEKPQMIMGITTTNHPPFELPKGIQLPALTEKVYANACFNDVGRDVLANYLRTYQYFNRSLARFLDEFKRSVAARNTVLVLTGDHNVRSILNYNVVSQRWQYSVPLYVYLPPCLRRADYPRHADPWGCHYDILATVAPYAFKHTSYLRLGQDLLADSLDVSRSYSFNEKQTLANPQFLDKAKRKSSARELLLFVYLQRVLMTTSR